MCTANLNLISVKKCIRVCETFENVKILPCENSLGMPENWKYFVTANGSRIFISPSGSKFNSFDSAKANAKADDQFDS